MKSLFVSPELEIVRFEAEDVITTSPTSMTNGGTVPVDVTGSDGIDWD